ncbi:hypothetical protein O3M35_005106 [Rhynocoris fuscipes]|uniref:Uncharacterized protein n=1 Tax=Rhynocoris fuscipes TaxID=488301 RepID=A0AAW1DH25_9HEMI
MQLFAFGATLRREDYIKISKFRTNMVANRTAQSCKFCVHHNLKTALASLKIFCIPF